MDPTEAEDIQKRWQEYTEEPYKNDLHDPDNHDGVIPDLEPDILECEVKWALESITTNKASGGDGIPVELFQILKDDAVKVLHSICQQIWKTQQWPQDWKKSVFILLPKKVKSEVAQSCPTLCDLMDLEPDILECEVKWALESIITKKASGGGGIPVELFQILKDDAVKLLHSICQQIWKTQQWPQD